MSTSLINDIAEIKALTDKNEVINKLEELLKKYFLDTTDFTTDAKQIYIMLAAENESVLKLGVSELRVKYRKLNGFLGNTIDNRYMVRLMQLDHDFRLGIFMENLAKGDNFHTAINKIKDLVKLDDLFLNSLDRALNMHMNDKPHGLWNYLGSRDICNRMIAQSTAVHYATTPFNNRYIFENGEQIEGFINNVIAYDYEPFVKHMNLSKTRLSQYYEHKNKPIINVIKNEFNKLSCEAKIKLVTELSETNPIEYAKNTLGKLSSGEKAKFLVEFVKTF